MNVFSISSKAWDGMFYSFLLPLCIVIIHCILLGITPHVKLWNLRNLWHHWLLAIVVMLWWHTWRLEMVTLGHSLWILVIGRKFVGAHLSLKLVNILQSTVVCVSTELRGLITRASLRVSKVSTIWLLWHLLITLVKLLIISWSLRWRWSWIELLLWIVVLLNIPCLFCWWVAVVSASWWHLIESIVRSCPSLWIRFSSELIWWKLSFKVDFTCWGSSFAQRKQVPHCGLQVAKLIYRYLRLSNNFAPFDAFWHNF